METLKSRLVAKYRPTPRTNLDELALYLEKLEQVQRDIERGIKISLPKEEKRFLLRIMQDTDIVYFICAHNSGKVKIGYTNDLKERLTALQIGSPEKLTIISHVRGNVYLERRLHKAFADERTHGEWFMLSERILKAAEIAIDQGLKGLLEYIKPLVDTTSDHEYLSD